MDSKDVSYGRVEMFVKKENKFFSICDKNFSNLAAKVVCRRLGYRDGLYQCCSALGTVPNANISIINVRCSGSEDSLDNCQHEFGTCPTNNYVSVYCSYDVLVPRNGKYWYIDDTMELSVLRVKVFKLLSEYFHSIIKHLLYIYTGKLYA